MSIAQELSVKILQILVEKSSIYQSDLTSVLEIKHDQRISEAIKILLDNHKIKRTKTFYNKKNTYLINLNGSSSHPRHQFNSLLRGDMFSPCCGCRSEDCIPSTCNKLMEWVTS